MFTIKDLLTLRPAPYTKHFKCKVLVISAPKPFNTKGEQKELYHIALGDTTGLIKATLYDEEKLKQMKVGSSIMLTNYILKADKTVTITSASKVFRCANIDVDDATKDSAEQLINPAPEKMSKIKLMKSSPKKTLTSLQGQVTKDEAAKQVMVRGTPSAVRNIFVKDETDEIEVALWRSSAETDATVNDWIEVTNVVVNEPNTYHSQTFVATTQNTTIKISAAPEYDKEIRIVAFTILPETATLVCGTDADGTTEYSISLPLLKTLLELPPTATAQDVEDTLAVELPFCVKVSIKKNEVLRLIPPDDQVLESD